MISDSMVGGIIWTENDWKRFGQQYDELAYIQILCNQMSHSQPAKETEVEYKEDMKVLFRYSKNKKYTHIDLSHAKTLGLQVVIIQDEYINFLFKLKNNGEIIGQIAKRVLNTLWGALCQRNKFYYNIDISMPELFENPEGEILDNIIPVGEDCWTLQFSNPRNLFKGEYPQIVPFLLAQGRKIISLHIAPYKDKEKQVHTDGFILEEDPMKPPLIECSEDVSKTLKMLKFEKKSECYVKNANQVTWY
ncbi:6642_t:CDS:2 [Entrophospora sp. SA101]|nr:6642_t:CDS:2 [Entrophospora sp. SA101]